MNVKELGEKAEAVADKSRDAELGIARERVEKERILNALVAAVTPALPALASLIPRAGRGVRVGFAQPAGDYWNLLYLMEDGSFMGARGRGALTTAPDVAYVKLTVEEVVDSRWSLEELATALKLALQAQEKGLDKKAASLAKTTKTVAAVADLLEGVR